MGEVIFFIVFGILMVGCWFLMKGVAKWLWFTLFATIALCVGGWEAYSFFTTGRTISQQFWAFSQVSPGLAWTIIGCLAVGWLMFLLHLAAKLLKRKE